MYKSIFTTLLLLLSSALYSQDCDEAPFSVALHMQGYHIGRALDVDNEDFRSQLEPMVYSSTQSRRSPVLAGLFSLLVPGTGELYAGNYLLAGLFATLEGVGWYYSIRHTRRGDEATTFFERYADAAWSVVRYAEWLNENAANFPGGENAVHIDINPDATLPPWERVNWEQMNSTEMAIPLFSHKLPHHGDQQYYEMIGKYHQYSYGWDDKIGGDYWDVSQNFLYYAGLRGDANRHYDAASTIINLLVVNHFLSAIDAAWAAARFNSRVELRSGAYLQRLPDGTPDMVTSARVSIRF